MALSSTTIWEIRPTNGTNTGGGGFNPGNANMATDLAATSATGTAPVVSSASYNFVAGDVGAFVFIKSGTNWTPGWYQIASVAANAATLTASIGSVYLYDANYHGGISGLNLSAGCASTASPTGGTWTIDYSQQNAVKITYTDIVCGGAGSTYTSVANPVGKNIIGNIVYVTGGDANITAGYYEISSTSTITATVVGATALSTGIVATGAGKLGGSQNGFSTATTTLQGKLVAGNKVYVKAEAWNENVTLSVAGSASAPIVVEGYTTTRGDNGRATNDLAGGAGAAFTNSGASYIMKNIVAKSAAGSGFTSSAVLMYINCISRNNGASGFTHTTSNTMNFISCEAYNNTTVGFNFSAGNSGGFLYGCYSHDNTSHGFDISGSIPPVVAIFCIADTNAGNGFKCDTGNVAIINCISYGNTGATTDGILFSTVSTCSVVLNTICSTNGRDGIRATVNGLSIYTDYNCYFANVGTARTTVSAGVHDVAIDPTFTDGPNGNFAIGTNLKALGFPGLFAGGLSTGYLDIGAVQRQESGGAGLSRVFTGQ